jgi:hypothetical protein
MSTSKVVFERIKVHCVASFLVVLHAQTGPVLIGALVLFAALHNGTRFLDGLLQKQNQWSISNFSMTRLVSRSPKATKPWTKRNRVGRAN